MKNSDELNFKANDPGAVKFGNFINYYQFHPPEHRMKNFPTNVWNTQAGENFVCLDIGCNSGNLTNELYNFLSNTVTVVPCDDGDYKSDLVMQESYVLGIDLDPCLISRAKEMNLNTNNLTFQCLDFMTNEREEVLSKYLTIHRRSQNLRFDVIFCFSVSMWIHLNHGDDGLKRFLMEIAKWSNMVVVEPQPWRCYRNAVRRLKRSGSGETFPLYNNLKLGKNIEVEIEGILANECGFNKLKTVVDEVQTTWGRRLLFFKRP